jgi:hypothetical protein
MAHGPAGMGDVTGKILHARCRIHHEPAIANFVAPIPDGENLAAVLRTGQAGLLNRYWSEKSTAFYIASDGEVAVCWTITDVTLEQAATLAVECESITDFGSKAAFYAAVKRAGITYRRVQ